MALAPGTRLAHYEILDALGAGGMGEVYGAMFAISPDNRTVYYGATRSEADIWLVERK